VQELGKYEIVDEIGRGSYGVVYRAHDTTLDRAVALKVLHPQLLVDQAFVMRFQREARILARLRHPNIVTVYEVAEAEGNLYIAMELARGPSLAAAIAKQGRIPWQETLNLIEPVCKALDYAHRQGIVHRDLKPANVLLDEEYGPMLVDFGIARLVGGSSVSLTVDGVVGTLAYIAPEVWNEVVAKAPADVYALGCIVYEMLTGEALFASATVAQSVLAHFNGPQFPAQWPDGVPERLEAALSKALAREPEDRFASAGEMMDALEQVVSGPAGEKALPTILSPTKPFEPEMVLIPAGEFLMGSDPNEDKDADDNEQPQRTLYLPNYYVARTPATNAQYLAFVQDAGWTPPGHWEGGKPPRGKENHPVVYVSWVDALAYCKWLSEATGRSYRLPSEAEWEKAARGTDGNIYPWGNQWDAGRCNNEESGIGDTTPVGEYSPEGNSPYGCVDMAGNVLEWTSSLYKPYPYDAADGREDPDAEGARVLRGGAFGDEPGLVRCAFRPWSPPGSRGRSRGFRVVLSPGTLDSGRERSGRVGSGRLA
jgi:serine/threonine-protein kinase